MTEAKQREQRDAVDDRIGEFARRVREGDSTADLFGVDDDFINAVVSRAYNCYAAKSFEQAEVLLRGATALDDDQSFAHLLLGDILLQGAQFSEAVEELEKARKLDGESAHILAKLGEAQVRTGRREDAVTTLQAALAVLDAESPHRKRTEALLHVASRNDESAEAGEPA